MSEIILRLDHLTKDYGHGRGIFDMSLEVKKGEVFGYVGTNGSGKTTTIRSLMGFIQANHGTASIMGLESWAHAPEIMKHVSYVPGEIAFPSFRTGTDFLKSQAEFLGVTDYAYMNHLIKVLQLDPSANLRRMSKGMKQKTALVAALMGEKEILILDEPTTGLDPLMREAFLDLIRAEKAKGRTIFMSSHIFEEIEEVCDKIAMIKDGRLINMTDLYELRHSKTRTYDITFKDKQDAMQFIEATQSIISVLSSDHMIYTISLPTNQVGELLLALKKYPLEQFHESKITLQEYFLGQYKKEGNA